MKICYVKFQTLLFIIYFSNRIILSSLFLCGGEKYSKSFQNIYSRNKENNLLGFPTGFLALESDKQRSAQKTEHCSQCWKPFYTLRKRPLHIFNSLWTNQKLAINNIYYLKEYFERNILSFNVFSQIIKSQKESGFDHKHIN